MKTLAISVFLFMFTASYAQKLKTASYRTAPNTNRYVAGILSKYDLVIMDLENAVNNRAEMVQMKKINPRLKILCYSNPLEIFYRPGANRPIQSAWIKEIYEKYPGWILKTSEGRDAVFYPGMHLLNISSACPRIGGLKYNEWMADRLLTKVLNDSIWDGYFMDNGGGNISWTYGGKFEKIDADNDGKADRDSLLDKQWSEGVRGFLNKIRTSREKGFLILANKGSVEFTDLLDGRMFEGFPNNYLGDQTDHGWWQCITNAHQTGKYTILQAAKEQDLELAITSALIIGSDAYVAIGQNYNVWPPQFDEDYDGEGAVTVSRTLKDGRIEIVPTEKSGKIIRIKELGRR